MIAIVSSNPQRFFELREKLVEAEKKLKRARENKSIDCWVKTCDSIKKQMEAIPNIPNEGFISSTIEYINTSIRGWEKAMEDFKKEFNKDPVYTLDWYSEDVVKYATLINIYKRLLKTIETKKNESKSHWIVWLNEILTGFEKEMQYRLISSVQSQFNSSSLSHNNVEIIKAKTLAGEMNGCSDFMSFYHRTKEAFEWAKKNNPALLTMVIPSETPATEKITEENNPN